MSGNTTKHFNLPYLQYDRYWIGLFATAGTFDAQVSAALESLGYRKTAEGVRLVQAPKDWRDLWIKTATLLAQHTYENNLEVAISAGDDAPTPDTAQKKTVAAVTAMAESLWLGEALLDDRVMCYFQPIVSEPGKIVGYESFARVKAADGSIIGGGKIIEASKALNAEHMIDRHLHVQAVRTYAASDFTGFLFINFFPGFIHRPAVYLEGLSEAAKLFGIVSKNLVLEFTRSETNYDLKHVKSVCDYARSHGYSIALDDIATLDNAKKLVAELRPDFVKIDALPADTSPKKYEDVRHIVELVHESGGTVIAEGVETEVMHRQLKSLGIDLFQGYLFSPPAPVVPSVKKQVG